MDCPSQVKAMLESEIADMATHVDDFAHRPGRDFTRRRKLEFSELIGLLVSMGTGSVSHELMDRFDYDPKRKPSKSAFCQQRAKLSNGAMRHLLRAFSSCFDVESCRDGSSLAACDGSSFCFGPDPLDSSTFHPNRAETRGHDLMHAVAFYGMLTDSHLDAVVQNGRESDEFGAMCSLVDEWDRGGKPIFVADRGFASHNVFAHVVEAGLFFVIRAKDVNVRRMPCQDGLCDWIDDMAHPILSRSQAKSKMLNPQRTDDNRLICPGIRFDCITEKSPEYEMSVRVVRFPVGDGFENIVTNLPADTFDAAEIKEMYRLRWGIETSFRKLKLNIGATELHSRKGPWGAREIFARMVLYDFCAAIARHVAKLPEIACKRGSKHAHKVNFADAARTCCAFLRGRARGPDVEGLVAGSTSPVRPGRSFHRRHRLRSPSGYAYRPA